MAMTSPYGAIMNFGFAARFKDGPAKARKADLAQERQITGKWERIAAEEAEALARKKAALRALRQGKPAVTAADFRHSALDNAVRV